MKKIVYSALCAILVLIGIAVLTPVKAAPDHQYTCSLTSYIYWSSADGDDANDGLSVSTAVRTQEHAKELAKEGGACIRIVQGADVVDYMDVYALNTGTGVPLAQAALYGLLMLLAVALVAVGLWARRKAQVQPGYQSQA